MIVINFIDIRVRINFMFIIIINKAIVMKNYMVIEDTVTVNFRAKKEILMVIMVKILIIMVKMRIIMVMFKINLKFKAIVIVVD